MKYLVVEDTLEYYDHIKAALSGEEIIFVSTYEEARNLLEGGEKPDRVITDLFIPESIGEKIGLIGKKLLEDLRGYEESPYIRSHHLSDFLEEKLAPLGLHIFGLAYSKGIPVMIASHGNRHSGALGFVRYALVGAKATMIHCFMAKFGEFYKEDLNQWRKAVTDFDRCIHDIAVYMPEVPEKTKKIFFGF